MPHLMIKTPDGKTRAVTLVKRITSIGRGQDNDIQLDDPAVPESALHILFDGSTYTLGGTAEFSVNGKTRSEHPLSASDRVTLGRSELIFATGNAPVAALGMASTRPAPSEREDDGTTEMPGTPSKDLTALRRLTVFSERLWSSEGIDKLLEALMDETIDITRADKGFLILMEGETPRVKVARNVAKQNLEDAMERVSDSIVTKVVQSRKPLIISDALDDPEFSASESVVNLKLLSVMCAPLMYKGSLFGLIYLGNDRLVNRFEQRSLDLLTIFAAQASLLLQNALLLNELKLDNTELRKRLEYQPYGEIIGSCASMRDVYKRVDKIAPTDIAVLITGETGTGKELIARELHRRSQRAKGPFTTINCGAIPENLLESELFGHVRGAFTGAVATKVGKFQAANGGTLFLDEIGEMPVQLQVKLLRALQEKIVYKVGDTRGEPVDIRVLAATNKDLEAEVKKGTFREDLYFRINVVTLHLPPLRERGDDLPILANFFLNKFTRDFTGKARGFTPAATQALRKFAWPGNIRELENRIKKAVVLADRPMLTAEDLDLRDDQLTPVVPLAQAKEDFQTRYILEVLERNSGNRTKTAKDLAVDPRTIFRFLEKMDAEKTGRTLAPEPDLDEIGASQPLDIP